jgi:hypothetical protein
VKSKAKVRNNIFFITFSNHLRFNVPQLSFANNQTKVELSIAVWDLRIKGNVEETGNLKLDKKENGFSNPLNHGLESPCPCGEPLLVLAPFLAASIVAPAPCAQ